MTTATETTQPNLQTIIDLERKAAETAFTSDQKLTLTIKTSALKEAVGRVSGSIAGKTTIPILTGLYFYVTQEHIELRGSDSKITTRTILPLEKGVASMEGDIGGVVFPGKRFTDLLARLTGVNTIIEFTGLKTKIKSKGAEVEMNTMHTDLYPALPVVNDARMFEIPTDVLLMMYKRTDYAVSKSQTEPVLTGVLHELEGNRFSTLATDRYRLARQVYDLDGEMEAARLTVPAETITEVKKSLKGTTVTRLRFNDSSVVYEIGKTTIYSSVLSATYPDASRLIPPTSATSFVLGSKEMKEIFDRCSLFADLQGTLAHMIVNAKQNRLRVITVKTEDGHQLKEDVRLVRGEGDDLVISFNVKYFTDMLAHAGDEQLQVGFNASQAPIVIRTVNGLYENVDLILPTRVLGAPATAEISGFAPVEFEGDPFADRADTYSEQAG